MKKLLMIAYTLLLFAGCSSKKDAVAETRTNDRERSERDKNRERPSIDEIFKMDTNNDGMLSKAELEDSPMVRNFERMDANSDGFITRTEFENAPRPQRGQRKRRNN